MAVDKFPESTWPLMVAYNSSPSGCDALFLPLLTSGVHTMHRHTCNQGIHGIIFLSVQLGWGDSLADKVPAAQHAYLSLHPRT